MVCVRRVEIGNTSGFSDDANHGDNGPDYCPQLILICPGLLSHLTPQVSKGTKIFRTNPSRFP